ncbi:MAG TPA: carboxypeptidase regulatory-like domain-containing protein [Pyrinomonadaceae bacterium]|nr:carboxypeptidase regulatory-like domain-containing protein [Pyrinomonadaceae bacterium]
MKPFSHHSIVWSVLIVCVSCVSMQSQTKVDRESLNTVSGKVTVKGKGVSGIVVSIRSTKVDHRIQSFSGRTDQDGNYRIGNVPRGTYQIAPSSPEFSLTESQQRLLILTASENVEAIDFALVRGGVITGKVTSSGNQPLIEASISYTVERIDEAGIQSSRTDSRYQTDDRGIYRLFGLVPGKYKVSVSRDVRNAFGQTARFTPTYYPATTDPSKASIIEITEGSEFTGIDIKVELNDNSSEKFTVKGRIIDGVNGQPVPNIRLRLEQLIDQYGTRYLDYLDVPSTSDREGEFSFEDIAPGQYGVIVEPSPSSAVRAERLPFVVTDQDVTDLVIKTVRAASVSGVVIVESTMNKAPPVQFSRLSLYSYPTDGNSGGIITGARINADGSFQLSGLKEGFNDLSLGGKFGRPTQGLSISRIERDGVVQNGGIEVKDGENITGVRVFLKFSNGTIRGVVKTTSGDLPRNAQVAVWFGESPADPRSFRASPVVDARGHFIIQGVPDGTYEIIANVKLVDSRIAVAKQQVIVADGNVPDITLIVEIPPGPGVKQ